MFRNLSVSYWAQVISASRLMPVHFDEEVFKELKSFLCIPLCMFLFCESEFHSRGVGGFCIRAMYLLVDKGSIFKMLKFLFFGVTAVQQFLYVWTFFFVAPLFLQKCRINIWPAPPLFWFLTIPRKDDHCASIKCLSTQNKIFCPRKSGDRGRKATINAH